MLYGMSLNKSANKYINYPASSIVPQYDILFLYVRLNNISTSSFDCIQSGYFV